MDGKNGCSVNWGKWPSLTIAWWPYADIDEDDDDDNGFLEVFFECSASIYALMMFGSL